MMHVTLPEIALLLAAMAIAAPLARALGIGTVLGYLIAGILLGPNGVRHVFSSAEAKEFMEFAEFGIVLLLFLIGLEMRPKRLWAMRNAVFGLGGQQVFITAGLIGLVAAYAELPWQSALFVGFALALSSTAFGMQVLEEGGDLAARHGRLAFAVLLFQDLIAIPLIAIAPLFAPKGVEVAKAMDLVAAGSALGTIIAIVVVGHFVLDHLIKLVALTKVKEAMTAAALLTVVGVSILMQMAGLSASLGAFIAGALLAESSYRHQLEADLQPFQGLLLGLFFTSIGMSLNLKLFFKDPETVLILAVGIVVIKSAVLYGLGRWQGLDRRPSARLGLSLSQGGEFGFVLFAAGVAAGVITKKQSDLLTVVVTISMAMTPFLLGFERLLSMVRKHADPVYDVPPSRDEHVVIAGFGRYGQIVARVLRGKKIPFTALDISPEQIDLVKRFGAEAFYGDASRHEILEAARTGQARAFVIAIDDVEASLKTAEVVTTHYPGVPVFARARNRIHAHKLLDLSVTAIQRETFLSALDTTRQVLVGLGFTEREAERTVRTFREHDERRLLEDYAHYSDQEKMQAKARSDAATLEKLFAEDSAEAARAKAAAGERGR